MLKNDLYTYVLVGTYFEKNNEQNIITKLELN